MTLSEQLKQKLATSACFTLKHPASSYRETLADVREHASDILLEILDRFFF
ncbi:MAG: hypothetical protein ACMUEM_04035 [Flavobacteriales bacterium AspAUS03]